MLVRLQLLVFLLLAQVVITLWEESILVAPVLLDHTVCPIRQLLLLVQLVITVHKRSLHGILVF
jgi:hypothetical protein